MLLNIKTIYANNSEISSGVVTPKIKACFKYMEKQKKSMVK